MKISTDAIFFLTECILFPWAMRRSMPVGFFPV
jgi:hypothetical protein